jgi:secreted trypsin-like serine protease
VTGTDVSAEQLEAARQWARATAGNDNSTYLQLVTAAYNATHFINMAADADERAEIGGELLRRTSSPPLSTRGRRADDGANPPSIYTDPAFVDNSMFIDESRTRIIGGAPTTDYPHCVAVGSLQRFCCTGTLIAPKAVLTAGHCATGGCAQRIFVGPDIDGSGAIVGVKDVVVHPKWVPDSVDSPHDDLAVLRLEQPVEDVEPCRIASLDDLAQAQTTRLVGYGMTDVYAQGGYGVRRMVDVGIASNDPRYGARLDSEFVAGMPNLDRDSCRGDSGGPAYIDVDGEWLLGGAVSRATGIWKPPRRCGDGGVYTRVAYYEDWLHQVLGAGG